MDDPWRHDAKWKQASHKMMNTLWFHLYEIPRTVKFRDRKYNRMVVARGWGEGRMESYCTVLSTEFQFCKMKKVLQMDGGDSCTMRMCLIALKWTRNSEQDSYFSVTDILPKFKKWQKMFQMVNVMLCIFYHSVKKEKYKANRLWPLVWNETSRSTATPQLTTKVQNWMANMEHSKYLFNSKYFCSTFMELCLKQVNRHTQFRDMQSAPGKKEGKKTTTASPQFNPI